MISFKHRPGPWKVGAIDTSGARRIEADNGQSVICYVAPWEDPTDEDIHEDPVMEANAQLIVAAPDLYVAAKALVTETASHPQESTTYWLVRPEHVQKLGRAVSKAGKARPTPLERLAVSQDESNLVDALETLFQVTGNVTFGGEHRVAPDLFDTAKKAFNKWKDNIR